MMGGEGKLGEVIGFVVSLSQYEEWKEQRALSQTTHSLNHSHALSALNAEPMNSPV